MRFRLEGTEHDQIEALDGALPFVVQVGFAGSRRLFDDPPLDPAAETQWIDVVMGHVSAAIETLPGKLQLSSQHFLCGVSAIACGADSIFTRVCRDRHIPQRIFLPQPAADFLAAAGADGLPDFTPSQRTEAESLVASSHIIQQRVVSQSPDRTDRFRETNSEILRASDVVVCLLRHNSHGKAGGTDELLRRARIINTPVLEIRVAVNEGQPICSNNWHIPPDYHSKQLRIPPLDRLSLDHERIPSSEQYCEPLKRLVSTQAGEQQRFFRYSAVLIMVTHILATLCATVAIAMHGHAPEIPEGGQYSLRQSDPAETKEPNETEHSPAAGPAEGASQSSAIGALYTPRLLAFELILLVAGFAVHRSLHHSEAASIWANARVVAELARSIRAIHPQHVYLEHLFRLPLPLRFRPLLHTLSVLHLRSTYGNRNDPWQPQRGKYLTARIAPQIGYYTDRLAEDAFRKKCCEGLFTLCSVLAMAATLTKLILLIAAEVSGTGGGTWPTLLGTMAVVLPVLAVAGLSWSAALDCQARIETFHDTLAFLERQKAIVPSVDGAAEFHNLILETETVLLGEVATWFSRRANTGVN